jgi:NhaA family Na+:H+ antiporter
VATDIAFAVGVLALLSKRVPAELRTFLLTLAVADDVGAILVIAVFYSSDISVPALAVAALALVSLFPLRVLGVASPWWYLPSGVVLWLALHEAGVHSTIAGVLLGLLTPVVARNGRPVLEQLEHRLHPWSSYAIIPLFALANAGVSLDGGGLRQAFGQNLAWGIIAGLVVGKTIGVSATAWIAAKSGLARLPENVSLLHLLGVGGLAGIGFTVSLFVAALAFAEGSDLLVQAKLGVLSGSLISALMGAGLLFLASRRGQEPTRV